MKEIKNNKYNNRGGVSAIIGVILMVAITVAIAGTVYVYISEMTEDIDFKQNYIVEGNVDYIYKNSNDKTIIIIDHQAYTVENNISDFDDINYGDLVRFYFYGDRVDNWEFIL